MFDIVKAAAEFSAASFVDTQFPPSFAAPRRPALQGCNRNKATEARSYSLCVAGFLFVNSVDLEKNPMPDFKLMSELFLESQFIEISSEKDSLFVLFTCVDDIDWWVPFAVSTVLPTANTMGLGFSAYDTKSGSLHQVQPGTKQGAGKWNG